ncbi:ShlB/FhaC/HecB family hemolysin secretion/activation protein [Rickettsiales bacterium LUAb2]
MLIKKINSFTFFIILLLVNALLVTNVYAESPAAVDRNLDLQKQTQQNVDRNLRNLQNITPFEGGTKLEKPENEEVPEGPSEEEACFTFNKINIIGNTVLSNKELANITNKYLNKCISIAIAQETLLEAIIKLYQSKGYILAVPYIPQQNLAHGVLEIVVKEGILASIEYDNNILPKRAVNFAFVGMVGNPVNLRYLEQALENLNKFGAYKVTMDLKPGSKAGESILVLNAEKGQRFTGSITFSNDYNSQEYNTFPNLYDNKIIVNLGFNGVLTNDSLNLTAQTTLHQNTDLQEGSFGLNYSVPLGYWDFILNDNMDLTRVISKQTYDTYNIDTISDTGSLDIKRTISRGGSYILRGVVRPNYYQTDTYINNLKTEDSYKLYFVDLGFEYQFFNTYVSVISTAFYTRGQPLFNQPKQGRSKQNQEDLIPQNEFDIGKLTVNTSVPIANKLTYNNNLAMQYSSDILYTINDFVAVSKQGVRGYQGVYANYNSGFTDQNELLYDLFMFNNAYINKISVLGAIDMGAAIDGYNMTITHQKVLYGYYVELRTTGKIAMSIGYAQPLNHVYISKNQQVVNFALTLSL